MRYRDYKNFTPGHYYHVYNRGQNQGEIFYDHKDYEQFLDRLQVALGQIKADRLKTKPVAHDAFEILAYCLMPNHYHFLVRQCSELGIGILINKVCTSYARYFNAKYQRIGNLFQDTYKAKLVDNDEYLTYLSAYIHNNPSNPFAYSYSSYQEYIGYPSRNICKTSTILKYFTKDKSSYQQFVDGYTLKMHNKIKHLEFEE
jgi:putative transposase